MARCMICNYCPSTDEFSDNYIEEGYDICVQCSNSVSESLLDLESEDNINATAPTEAVQTVPEGDPGKDTREKLEPSRTFYVALDD